MNGVLYASPMKKRENGNLKLGVEGKSTGSKVIHPFTQARSIMVLYTIYDMGYGIIHQI